MGVVLLEGVTMLGIVVVGCTQILMLFLLVVVVVEYWLLLRVLSCHDFVEAET
jgi:hypothetical protein